jgi:hypothetical protein
MRKVTKGGVTIKMWDLGGQVNRLGRKTKGLGCTHAQFLDVAHIAFSCTSVHPWRLHLNVIVLRSRIQLTQQAPATQHSRARWCVGRSRAGRHRPWSRA